MIGPPFLFFTFFLLSYVSCDHHTITSVTIVQVTYCPSDVHCFVTHCTGDTIVSVTSIVLVTLLF